MRTFKTTVLHYSKFLEKYVGIDYDYKSEMTYETHMIVGITRVTGEIVEHSGDIAETLVEKYLADNEYKECPIDEFEKYRIGDKL